MDESEIPIDIHTSKLMDWLISRRHVPREWQKSVLVVREKINEAIKDMPIDKGITELLSGSYINYYHCKKLIDILKETEAKSKNLFGQYNSKRMKDWVEIVRLYEKDNVYLGEVASLLLRNINYEVPALKKQIAKTVHISNECDKKEKDYIKLAESIKKDFNASCKSLGIEGVKIKKELIEKAGDFPQMCEEIAEKIKNLKPGVEFYVKAVNLLLGNQKPILEILQYVIENGNTTVYQWKYKKVPSSVETITLVADEEEGNEESDTIDFGLDLDTNAEENIDWGISTVEPEVIETKQTGNEKSVATGVEARTVMGHPDTRNQILNNVLELEAFLKLRLYEMKSEMDSLSLSTLPDSLQLYDIKAIESMLKQAQEVVNSLTNPTSLHYLNIVTNPRYVDQLADKLKQKLTTHEKMLTAKECVKVQRAEAISEGEALKPKVDLLIKKSLELQELIEQDISRRYKGRPVNLLAGANLL